MSVDTNMQITSKNLNSDFFTILPTFFNFLKENNFVNTVNQVGVPYLNTRYETSIDQYGINGFLPMTINERSRNIFISISTLIDEDALDDSYYIYFNLHCDDDSVAFFKQAADYMRKHLPNDFKVWLRECDIAGEFIEVQ